MASENPQHVDASHSIFNDVRGIQINNYKLDAKQDLLGMLEPARMDPCKRTECLADTRVNILKCITDWATDSASAGVTNSLWLYGLAGSGKSTIATTIANYFRESRQLGAFLFFDRDVADRSDPTRVVRTLAYLLGTFYPRVGEHISDAIENNHSVLLSPIPSQFEKLIVEPLRSVDFQPRMVIVLDALDECGTEEDRRALVEVLAVKSVNLPSYVRLIITSRADADIRYAFDGPAHILPLPLDTDSNVVNHDISTYLQHRMTWIRRRKQHLGHDWPGEYNISTLAHRAAGLFIWASTAANFIDAHDPVRRLDIVLREDASPAADSRLDALYRTTLNSSGLWEDKDFVDDFRFIMGTVLTLRNPLSSVAIDNLLGDRLCQPSIDTVRRLSSVISSNSNIRVIHPSFEDFLVNRSRCKRDIWFFEKAYHNRALAIRCLRLLNGSLGRNLYGLTLSAPLEATRIPEHVAYACNFWIHHVCMIKEDLPKMRGKVQAFLNRHLLHWFETMSIMKKSWDTISLLNSLLTWITMERSDNLTLRELVGEALRFARIFATSIERHPLFVYYSALPFTPITSIIYKTFRNPKLDPTICHGHSRAWPPLLQVMTTHTSEVRSVAFSASREHVISGSNDGIIHIWNASTGTEVIAAFRCTAQPVISVAISPDGSRIVSSSHDSTIRIWDALSGTEVLPALRRTAGPVAFSRDGTRIVSGSWDRTILVIDATSGMGIFPAFEGHTHWVHSVAFSPDGDLIVSGSEDGTVRVWEVETGTEIFPAIENGACIHSVSFSPNGTHIIAGLQSGIIRIWNIYRNGEKPLDLEGHEGAVLSVTFSPDGNRIASGSEDQTVRVWYAKGKSQAISVLQGHDRAVSSVAFNSHGTSIASGSHDNTIRVWDARNMVSGTRSSLFSLNAPYWKRSSQFRGRDVGSAVSGTRSSPYFSKILYRHFKATRFSPPPNDDEFLGQTPLAHLLPDKSGIVIQAFKSRKEVTLKPQTPSGDMCSSFGLSTDRNYIISRWKSGTRIWDFATGEQCLYLQNKTPPRAGHQDAILELKHRWIVHISTDRAICKLPPWIDVASSVSCLVPEADPETILLGIRTANGSTMLIAFPILIVSSSDTRRVAGESAPHDKVVNTTVEDRPRQKKRVFGARIGIYDNIRQ